MTPTPSELLVRTFAALQKPLLGFQASVCALAAQIDSLNEIRVDGHVTQLFVDIEKKRLLWELALATEASIQIRALLALKPGMLSTLELK